LIAFNARDFDAHEADVANVVLRAGVVATGDVEVDGLVEDGEACVEMAGEIDGVGFSVRGGEAAALVACAGNGSGEDCAGVVIEACVLDSLRCDFEVLGRNVGDDEVLPDGEAEFTGAEVLGYVGERTHLRCGEMAYGDGNADVVEAGLRLRMNAEVRGAIDGAAWFALGDGNADEWEG